MWVAKGSQSGPRGSHVKCPAQTQREKSTSHRSRTRACPPGRHPASLPEWFLGESSPGPGASGAVHPWGLPSRAAQMALGEKGWLQGSKPWPLASGPDSLCFLASPKRLALAVHVCTVNEDTENSVSAQWFYFITFMPLYSLPTSSLCMGICLLLLVLQMWQEQLCTE